MKIITIFLSVLCWSSICQSSRTSKAKDERLTAVTATQLRTAISQTQLDSPLHEQLLSRARYSHLMNVAYSQYTELLQRQPNNPYANLYRGISAEYLEQDIMKPELKERYNQFSHEDLFPIATSCLEKAVRLLPNSAFANMEEGFFMWQFGNELPQGLAHLKRAAQLAPNDPRVHALWGLVYSNPFQKTYDPQKAVSQLKLAIALRPTYAFPHELLADVYNRLGQPAKAEEEQKTFESLLP